MTKEQIKRGIGYTAVGAFLIVACVVLCGPFLLLAMIGYGGKFIINLVETKDIPQSFFSTYGDISDDLRRCWHV